MTFREQPPHLTDRDYDDIERRLRAGQRLSDIAVRYGIDRPKLFMRLKKRGRITKRPDPLTAIERRAVEARRRGLSYHELAERFGVSVLAVRSRVCRGRHKMEARS